MFSKGVLDSHEVFLSIVEGIHLFTKTIWGGNA